MRRELIPQPPARVEEARHDRALRNPERDRDLAVGELLEVAQREHLAVARREPLESAAQEKRRFVLLGAARGSGLLGRDLPAAFLSGSARTIALWNPPKPLPTVRTTSVSWSRASIGT